MNKYKIKPKGNRSVSGAMFTSIGRKATSLNDRFNFKKLQRRQSIPEIKFKRSKSKTNNNKNIKKKRTRTPTLKIDVIKSKPFTKGDILEIEQRAANRVYNLRKAKENMSKFKSFNI